MKTIQFLLTIILCTFLLCPAHSGSSIDYFDQTPPGDSAIIFSSDFILTVGEFIQNGCFSPDGNEFIFVISDEAWSFSKIMYTKYVAEEWSEPDTLSFTIPVSQNLVPCFSSDGQKIFFISQYRNGYNTADIWVTTRMGDEWEEPVRLDEPVNSNNNEWEVSIAENGTLYFSSDRSGGYGNMDIYRAECIDGAYSTIENLGPPINTGSLDECPYISPDESYLVFNSWKPNEHFDLNNLYVSYRKNDHTWTNPKDLGSNINTDFLDIYPTITPDTNYLIFTRRGILPGDDFASSKLFWVSAGIIDTLRNTNFLPYAKYPIPDMVIEVGQEIAYEISDTTFYDDDENDTLSITASLNNGAELPGWLDFDESSSTFSGISAEAGSYTVKVTATDNEGGTGSDIFQIRIQNAPDFIEDEINADLLIYPNPAGDILYFHCKQNTTQYSSYTVTDLSGNILVRECINPENRIDISSLYDGVYIIRFEGDDRITNRKLIIHRG